MGIYLKKLQTDLSKGQWVFDQISSQFESSIKSKFNSCKDEHSVLEFCMSLYKQLNINHSILCSSSQGLNDLTISKSTRDAINRILSENSKFTKLSSFSENESKKIKESLLYIKKNNTSISKYLDTQISVFLRVNGNSFRSASHPHMYGAILIGDGFLNLSLEDSALSIVHELAHHELFLINLADRLVNKEFDQNQIFAPLQKRERPPIGRLHSLWALYRMAEFTRDQNLNHKRYSNILLENLNSFHAKELTEFAVELVQIVKRRWAC